MTQEMLDPISLSIIQEIKELSKELESIFADYKKAKSNKESRQLISQMDHFETKLERYVFLAVRKNLINYVIQDVQNAYSQYPFSLNEKNEND